MQKYIIDREMMLLALQWMPEELRDEWASECIEVPEWAAYFLSEDEQTTNGEWIQAREKIPQSGPVVAR
jgi:hypothetical protein